MFCGFLRVQCSCFFRGEKFMVYKWINNESVDDCSHLLFCKG